MSRKKHASKRKNTTAFDLTSWLYLFLAWLSSFISGPQALAPKVLALECSDDEELVERPSWAVIPAKLQEQNNQISALMQDVELLQEQKISAMPMSDGDVNLDRRITRLETSFFENQQRKHKLHKLSQRCDSLCDSLIGDLSLKCE
jgi:hypothetical protein